MNDRLTAGRSANNTGCLHQAMELFLALLSSVHARGVDTETSQVASIVVTLDYRGKTDTEPADEYGQYYAAFVLSDENSDLPLHRLGDPADSPAQAVINLLVTMHDEMLMGVAKNEVSH